MSSNSNFTYQKVWLCVIAYAANDTNEVDMAVPTPVIAMNFYKKWKVQWADPEGSNTKRTKSRYKKDTEQLLEMNEVH